MEQFNAPFRYDIVGSFLRPHELKEARRKFAEGTLSREELTAVEDETISKLIAKEKEVGLKAVTDGEFRRRWWHLDFIAGLNGISIYDFVTDDFGIKKTMQSSFVSSPISFNEAHPFLTHFKRTKEIAGKDTLLKQTIPGPNMVTLSAVLLSEQYRQAPVYKDLDAMAEDLSAAYRAAIRAFHDAGCRYLQLDDTSWGALFSKMHRDRLAAKGYDPDKLIDLFGEITEGALKDRPKDMVITTHMCKGNFQSHWLYEGTYEKIAKRLLGIEGFDGFFLEYDDERSGDFAPLRHLKGQKMVLGLVTTKTPELEDPDHLRRRIMEAAKIVPLDQLCISPQCGFASTEEGNAVTEEDQWKKLRLVKEVADSVWH